MCFSVLQYVAVFRSVLQRAAMCCSVLQCAAVCCIALQCVAFVGPMFAIQPFLSLYGRNSFYVWLQVILHVVATNTQAWLQLIYYMAATGGPHVCDPTFPRRCRQVCCSALQCAAVCCSVLQRAARCGSVL